MMRSSSRVHLLLAAGAALIVATHLRWGIGVLAWIAPVPLLAYLRQTAGWRARLALAGTVIAAWIVAVLKIITPPVPLIAALGFGVAIGIFSVASYFGWDLVRRRVRPAVAVLAFPAPVVVTEWLQAHLTPVGTWGATAHTQHGDLALLQVASLFGAAGVTFLVAWTAAAIEHALVHRSVRDAWRSLAAPLVAVIVAHGFGAGRLGTIGAAPTARIAAVGTDATFAGPPLPGAEELARIDAALFARTRAAARAGARLVVWNEGATLVWPADEAALVARAAAVAREESIELVIAYISPTGRPFPFHNRYVWLRSDGTVATRYDKRQPVPGEPAIAGDHRPTLIETGFGRATGIICYDGDFPAIVREATEGADLLVIPSSDWRGIDPIHSDMIALRAIENGVSVLRSTRLGLSVALDPYGRVHGALSSFETDDRILIATLPVRRVWTLYAAIGDLFVALCALSLVGALAWRRRRMPGARKPASV